jgi:hypothetical protein
MTRGQRLFDKSSDSRARGIALPTTIRPARTWRPINIKHHVTNFTGKTISSSQELAVRDNPGANTRAEGHHHHVVVTLTCSMLILGQRCKVRIVPDTDLRIEKLRQVFLK